MLLIDHFIYCSDIDDNMHGLGPVQKRKNISFATCNRIVQISKQLIKVEVAGGFADAAAELLRRVSFLYLQDMAQYIPAAYPGGLFEKGDYMHSEKWLLILINLITVGSRCHNVGHPRVSFGQICREVHFLPSEFLFALYSRKPEVRAQSAPFYEIQSTIQVKTNRTHGLVIDEIRVVFLSVLFDPEFFTICFNIFQDMLILMPFQPSIFPVEQNWLTGCLYLLNLARVGSE